MEFKKLLALFAVFLAVSGIAMAIDRTTGVTSADYARWTPTPGGSDVTEGGNITSANLTSSALTDKWAGYFGNVTGTLLLRKDGDTWDLYNWTYTPEGGGEVCTSTNPSFTFTGAVAATAANINTAWNFTSTDADDAVDTFNDGTCVDLAFSEGTVSSAIMATHMGSSNYYTCAITDIDGGTLKNDFAFCTHMTLGNNYLGEPVGYELLSPTPEGRTTSTSS